jgi:SnoaL-like domain
MNTFGVEDRTAILELIANYAYMWDGKDADGFSDLFAEDAIWESYYAAQPTPAGHLQTRAELRSFAVESFAGRLVGVQTRHHQNSTILTQVHPDSARGKTIFLVTHQRTDEVTPRLIYSGVYEDTFVKSAIGWRFARRVAHFGGQQPQPQPAADPTSGASPRR